MGAIVRILLGWLIFSGMAQAGWVTVLPATAKVIEPLVGPVEVLLPPGQSPHQWALRPSSLRKLAAADQVVLAVPTLAQPVYRWLVQHDRLPHTLIWSRLPGVRLIRGDHHDHDAHGHAQDAAFNPHLWLSPDHARLLLQAVARRSGRNADAALRALARARQQADALLVPVRHRPYLVLHDAFAYFERDFGLRKAGVIEPDVNGHLGLRRLMAIRTRIEREKIRCIIYPAHQSPKLLRRLIKGLDVKLQPLDALGWRQRSYADWLVSLAEGYRACLTY